MKKDKKLSYCCDSQSYCKVANDVRYN